MFRLYGNKTPKEPMPSWLKWALVAFLGYAVINAHNKEGAPSLTTQAENLELSIDKVFDFSSFKNKVFPSFGAALRVKDIAPGKGFPAVCGQEVKIAYATYFANEKPVGDTATAETPLVFRIGEGKVMPVFEQSVIGMLPGGKRSVLASPPMSYGIKEFARDNVPANVSVRFDIELLEALPALPDADASPYRIAEVSRGPGNILLCGQSITAKVTVWDTEGTKLYPLETDAPPVTFAPGKSEVFLGLEQGVIGMPPGSMRTLVVPPAFQGTMHGNKPVIAIPLPKHKTVLVDVESVP